MAFSTTVSKLIDADRTGLLAQHPSWRRVQLSYVAEVKNGAAFKASMFSKTSGTPLIRIRDVMPGFTSTYYSGDYDRSMLVQKGEILIGMDGDFNLAIWSSEAGLLNQRVCKVTPNEKFYSKSFLAFVLPGYLAAINENTSSVTVKHLSSKTINEIELPLPSRAEQDRIVAKLDELFTELDAGIADLHAARIKIQILHSSVLKSAVEGVLTSDWRKNNPTLESGKSAIDKVLIEKRKRWESEQLDKYSSLGKEPPHDWESKYKEPTKPVIKGLPRLPSGWGWASIAQIASYGKYSLAIGPFGSNLKVSDYRTDGVPLVFVRNIRSGKYGAQYTKYITNEKFEELGAHSIDPGDVLVTKMGDPPGDADVYPKDQPSAVITADCIKVRCWQGLIRPEFLKAVINSHLGRQQIKPITQGVAQKKVSLGRFSTLSVPVPPLEEQDKILELLRGIQEDAVTLDESIAFALQRSASQRINILKKAVCGDLVEPRPDEEPSNLLLDRIKLEYISIDDANCERRKKIGAVRVKQNPKDMLRNWIGDRTKPTFTFEELKDGVSIEYEAIQAAIFELLSERNPLIEQYLDRGHNGIAFRRLNL